jgi:hypothetical protein
VTLDDSHTTGAEITPDARGPAWRRCAQATDGASTRGCRARRGRSRGAPASPA